MENSFKTFFKLNLYFTLFAFIGCVYFISKNYYEDNIDPTGRVIKVMKDWTSPEKEYSTTYALPGFKFHNIANVAVFSSIDETGYAFSAYAYHTSFMQEHWSKWDNFGYVKMLNAFKEMVRDIESRGVKASDMVFTENFLEYEKIMAGMERDNAFAKDSIFYNLKTCRKQNWIDKGLIHHVAELGCLDCVKWLVEEKDIDINHPSCKGNTPAMLAAHNNHYAIVEYLVPLMSKKALLSQNSNKLFGSTLFNMVNDVDHGAEYGDPLSSIYRIEKFLQEYRVKSTKEIGAEEFCFPPDLKMADPYRNKFISIHSYDHDNNDFRDNSGIESCLYLYAQYDYNYKTYGYDNEKKKQIYKYIEKRGFNMSVWNKIKHRIEVVKPSHEKELSNASGKVIRMFIQQENGKKCNDIFSDCDVTKL